MIYNFTLRKLVKMRFKYLLLFCLILLTGSSFAQLSDGGFPLQVVNLKSANDKAVELPRLKSSVIEKIKKQNEWEEEGLKPLQFAHAFEVNLNPSNSGQWYETSNGYNVWKLTIRSENALSLNLIFDAFDLPDAARLFVYNESENHYLGAFTSQNNKASGRFAIAPVSGDEITVQYEVPKSYGTPNDFEITKVNHDFIGILKYYRRPFNGQLAGDCNIDVNCEEGEKWRELKNSVCRVIIGNELCSGVLVNNTAEDQKPYVLSAAHCYDAWDEAEIAIYTFNYESPYCAPLDGDPMNTISGAIMKAHFDSLDFALTELTVVPPPSFRPYFAGWNKGNNLPDSSLSIHHPVGDIKKIAFENDPVTISNFTNSNPKPNYTSQGFLRVGKWDNGVTEIGSSGGPLYNTKEQVIGTLTGGAALCGNPYDDYYSRFQLQWDFSSDSTKQLKCWLDPNNSGVSELNAKQFNTDDNLCMAFTHLKGTDDHANIGITVSGQQEGYWGGTNNLNITEFVEKFHIEGNEILDGVSFGVGKMDLVGSVSNSEIKVKVYNGEKYPEDLIYSKNVRLRNFAVDAMNYISFDELVEPDDTFFVGFELSNLQASDTFAIYQSLRTTAGQDNHFYFKRNGSWMGFDEANSQGYGMVNVFELVACGFDEITDTPIVDIPENVWLYPNPANSEITLESDEAIEYENVSLYNMLGQEVGVNFTDVQPYRLKVQMLGNRPGIYFIRFNYGDKFVTRKFSFMPQ